MMPAEGIIKRVGFILEDAASAKTTKDLLEIAFRFLQKQKSESEEEILRTLLRSAVDVSFLVLLGGKNENISELQKQFKKTLEEIETLQVIRFENRICQCAPWSEVIPLLAAGGGYIDAITPEMGTQERFNYCNEAVKKFRAALLKLKSSKTTNEKNREAANELSEMEQLDEKKVQPKLEPSAEGKPW
jgi:DNA-binding Lrp family transcriptional regulator